MAIKKDLKLTSDSEEYIKLIKLLGYKGKQDFTLAMGYKNKDKLSTLSDEKRVYFILQELMKHFKIDTMLELFEKLKGLNEVDELKEKIEELQEKLDEIAVKADYRGENNE